MPKEGSPQRQSNIKGQLQMLLSRQIESDILRTASPGNNSPSGLSRRQGPIFEHAQNRFCNRNHGNFSADAPPWSLAEHDKLVVEFFPCVLGHQPALRLPRLHIVAPDRFRVSEYIRVGGNLDADGERPQLFALGRTNSVPAPCLPCKVIVHRSFRIPGLLF